MNSKWFEKKDDGIICTLCPNRCFLRNGKSGICRGRSNNDGQLHIDNYAMACSLAMDPIEKKPLYHFYPGSNILSTGVNGCNLQCEFCQNWQISQGSVRSEHITPQQLVNASIENDSIGIAFTYTEPFIWWEYIYDTAQIARKHNQKIVLVSNGYVNKEPLNEILPFIDAINIDLKSFSNEFYKKYCKGDLETVKENIRIIARSNCHIEITTLLITGLNDTDAEIRQIVEFIAGIDKDIPIHFSRYFPNYKMHLHATDIGRLQAAKDIAEARLSYVYLGNVHTDNGSSTFCPECNAAVVSRDYYSVKKHYNEPGICPQCGFRLKRFIGA